MKRFNLKLTDDQHQKLLELQKEMGAASVSEALRRLVHNAYRRVKSRSK